MRIMFWACFISSVCTERHGLLDRKKAIGDATRSKPSPISKRPRETLDPSTVNPIPADYVPVVMSSTEACRDILFLFRDLNPGLFPNKRGVRDPISILHTRNAEPCIEASCDATFTCVFQHDWYGCNRRILQQFLAWKRFSMLCKTGEAVIVGGLPGKSNANVKCMDPQRAHEVRLDQIRQRNRPRTTSKTQQHEDNGLLNEIDDRDSLRSAYRPTEDTGGLIVYTGPLCIDLPGPSAQRQPHVYRGLLFDLTPYLLLDPPRDYHGKHD